MSLLSTEAVAQFREETKHSRSELAYGAIREAIATGHIKPGEWLRQEALAKALNVSHVPVREALVRLVAEGLAVHIPYKGVRAVVLSPSELRDVYEARALLEGFAIELAAKRITHADLVEMRTLLPKVVICESAHPAEKAWKASRRFHLIAVRASGRQHLTGLVEQVLDLTNPYGILTERVKQERLNNEIQELEAHARILENLEARKGSLARETVMHHMDKTLQHLINMLGK